MQLTLGVCLSCTSKYEDKKKRSREIENSLKTQNSSLQASRDTSMVAHRTGVRPSEPIAVGTGVPQRILPLSGQHVRRGHLTAGLLPG